MRLYRLRADGECLLSDAFLRGSPVRLHEDSYAPFVEESARDLDLTQLGEGLDDLLRSTPPHNPELDSAAAPVIHRHLPLSRREAADASVWRFLTVVFRPEFVRHRWGHIPGSLRRHFWEYSSRPRPEHNALSRLWWIAELSRAEADYSLCSQALDPRFKVLFKCQLGHYSPAVRACLDVLGDLREADFARAIKELNRQLALIPVEGLSEDEIRNLLGQVA